MSTDSAQVMRVLDRCVDTARSGSGTVPGVAAAAALAKADPDLHDAISRLLTAQDATSSWECWSGAMAATREAQSGNFARLERCGKTTPFSRLVRSCKAASRAAGAVDHRTAAILIEALLAGVMLEMSSLGNDRSRELRNRAVHSDVAAVRVLSRRSADRPAEGGSTMCCQDGNAAFRVALYETAAWQAEAASSFLQEQSASLELPTAAAELTIMLMPIQDGHTEAQVGHDRDASDS